MKRKPAIQVDLLAWRNGRGWTQKQAADALGLPIKTFIAWEKGRRSQSQLLPLAIAHLDDLERHNGLEMEKAWRGEQDAA